MTDDAPQTSLRVVPVTLTAAREFVERHHSHHHAPIGGLFAAGVALGDELVCVAILSRPVARRLQEQGCAEISRVASVRVPHAASMAIGAVTRAARALGWLRLVSYTLLGEAGTSYRAAGWWPVMIGKDEQTQWQNRDRAAPAQPGAKVRWEWGPGALPRDADVDAAVRAAVGNVELSPRGETLPLFRERR